jgi:hypothetical protein
MKSKLLTRIAVVVYAGALVLWGFQLVRAADELKVIREAKVAK